MYCLSTPGRPLGALRRPLQVGVAPAHDDNMLSTLPLRHASRNMLCYSGAKAHWHHAELTELGSPKATPFIAVEGWLLMFK